MSKKLRLAIHGAAGRMGKRLIVLASQDPDFQLVAALEAAGCPELGRDAGEAAGIGPLGLPLTSSLAQAADAVIDFSNPAGAEAITLACRQQQTPLVLATTGLTPRQRQLVLDASQSIPVVSAPNMSLAVNLTLKLAQQAARALRDHPGGADVEILERHHRFKEDAPSGTALRFGEVISAEMGQSRDQHGRHGQIGPRPHDEIGYHAIRVGDNPGEHTLVFGLLGESIELTVRAANRDCYAVGALAAAKFVVGRPPGLYGMDAVLGL